MRANQKSFLASYWDKLVLLLSVLVLLAGAAVLVVSLGVDPDEVAGEKISEYKVKSNKDAVPPVDMTSYAAAIKGQETPSTITEPAETQASFLASGARVFCEACPTTGGKGCGSPIPMGSKSCPICKVKQPEELKVALDSDGDGIPDEIEVKYGMNPNDPSDADEDLDGDGFTNAEEIAMKTNPNDKSSHGDYLESLAISGPLKETLLPFVFEKALQTPNGLKYYFKDPRARNDYGQRGVTYSVFADEPIGKTGFVAKKYEKKSQKVKISGANVSKDEDISTATIERVTDKKSLTLLVGSQKHIAVDVQATLVFSRGDTKQFTVVPGDTIELFGEKHKILTISRDGKESRVTVEGPLGQKKILTTVE